MNAGVEHRIPAETGIVYGKSVAVNTNVAACCTAPTSECRFELETGLLARREGSVVVVGVTECPLRSPQTPQPLV